MAILTVNYETMVKSLVDGPTEEDRSNNQAGVDESLDTYLDYVRGVVEGAGHQVEVDYGQEWGPSLTVGSDVSDEDEIELRLIVEAIPSFWVWYN